MFFFLTKVSWQYTGRRKIKHGKTKDKIGRSGWKNNILAEQIVVDSSRRLEKFQTRTIIVEEQRKKVVYSETRFNLESPDTAFCKSLRAEMLDAQKRTQAALAMERPTRPVKTNKWKP